MVGFGRPDGLNQILGHTIDWWVTGVSRGRAGRGRQLCGRGDAETRPSPSRWASNTKSRACGRPDDPGFVLAASLGDASINGTELLVSLARLLPTASMAAQRTSGEPCLVVAPRRTTGSDSLCLG